MNIKELDKWSDIIRTAKIDKGKLIILLKELSKSDDYEVIRSLSVNLLLAYINDVEIEEAYKDVFR